MKRQGRGGEGRRREEKRREESDFETVEWYQIHELSLSLLPGKLTVSAVDICAVAISDMEHQILRALRIK